MSLLRRVLEATACGLLVALLAPPVAGLVFLLSSAVWSANPRETFDPSLTSVQLLILGVTTGAYMLGAIPAFFAGLALPTLRRILSPILAAAATGLLGIATYSLTFGSHLISGPWPIQSTLLYVLPAFSGVALAALCAVSQFCSLNLSHQARRRSGQDRALIRFEDLEPGSDIACMVVEMRDRQAQFGAEDGRREFRDIS